MRQPDYKKRVTMMDVAKAAGCSQATVSIVLNNVTDIKISPDLRARVLDAARSLGYGRGTLRGGLEGLRGNCVGFIVDQLATTPEAVNAIEGARQASWSDDVTILIAQTQGRSEHERKAVARLLQAGIRGLIYMSIFTRRVALDPIFRDLPVPLALLNCYTSESESPSVVPDELSGGRLATATLIAKGHRRIGTIVGETFMEAAQDRLAGYREALSRADIAYDGGLVVDGNWTPTSGYEATKRLLALDNPPTAIFCQNDKMAMGCFMAAAEAGLNIPGDLAVIGYDDDELSRHLRPQLTTLELPHREMGAWAITQLAKKNGRKPHRPHKVTCTLIERASTGSGRS